MKQQTHYKIIGGLILWIALALLAAIAASGCGTIGGIRDDVGDVIDHSRQHLITDPQ